MDNKLLLAVAIMLLFRESQLANKGENSSELVAKIVETVQITEVNMGINRDRDTLLNLRNFAMDMAGNPLDTEYAKDQLLVSLRYACGDDDILYNTLEQGIMPDHEEKKLKRTIISLKGQINRYFRDQEIRKTLDKAAMDFRLNRNKISDLTGFINGICENLQKNNSGNGEADPAIVSSIDFSDKSGLTGVFLDIQKENSSEGILKLGHQLLNEELQGGIRRGEFCILSALQHKNKTGFTLNMFKQIALYNTPFLYDKTKKPLLWFCALENSLNSCVMWLYQSLYENATNSPYIINEKETPEQQEEKARFVCEELGKNGFTVKLDRVDPTQWSYMHLCNKMLQLESEGFEIVAAFVDYLAMIPTTGCTAGAIGQDRRDQFRRVRNFTSRRKIAFVTPHQLSQDATQLIREGRDNLVQVVAGKNYYDGCKTIGQECDVEIHIHIEEYNGGFYQTVQRGKHRGVPVLNPKLCYGILPFKSVGGLRDDLNGARTDIKKFGQLSMADQEHREMSGSDSSSVAVDDWA